MEALKVNRGNVSAPRRLAAVLLVGGPLAVSLAWGWTPSAIFGHASNTSSALAPAIPPQPGPAPGTCSVPHPTPDTWTTLVDETHAPPPQDSGIFLPSYQVVVDPWRPCLMYRAASGQDVERSLDSGATWQPTFHDAEPAVPGTGGVSVPQASPYFCVAVSLSSTDCLPQPPAFAARDLQIPAPGWLVMAESGNGDAVLRSDDQGHAWYLADGGIEGRRIESVTPAPGHPNVLYAVVDAVAAAQDESTRKAPDRVDPPGLYVSKDGGGSWTAAVAPPRRAEADDSDPRTQLQVDPDDPSHLWLMVRADACPNNASVQTCAQIFESTDSAKDWQPILPASSSVPPLGNQFLVTRTASHALRLYLNSGDPRHKYATSPPMVSVDDGLDWSPLPVPPLILSSLAVDPADPDTMVYAGSLFQGTQGSNGDDVLTYFVTHDGWQHVQQGRGLSRGQSRPPVSPLRNSGGTSDRSIMIQADRAGNFYLLLRDHPFLGDGPDRQRFVRLTPIAAPAGAGPTATGGTTAGSGSPGSGSGSSPGSTGGAATVATMQAVGSCNLPITDGSDQEGALAFDGDSLLYTKSLDPSAAPYTATVYRIDPRTCAPLPSLTLHFDPAAIAELEARYGAPPGSMRVPYVGDLAFDNGHDTLWMVLGGSAEAKALAASDSAQKVGVGSTENPVFSATLHRAGDAAPTDADAVRRFFTPGGGKHSDVLDLFAYDYTDDTLWARGAVQSGTGPSLPAQVGAVGTGTQHPAHLDVDGRPIQSCWDQVDDYTGDGYAAWVVGAPGRLYVQSEDDQTIWELDSATCSILRTYIHRNFGEPNAENEQMACDAVTFGTGSEYARANPAASVIWLRDAVNQQAVAYAIPDGVCPIPTRTTYLGSTPSTQRDQTHFCAQLKRRGTLAPIADRTIVFSVGGHRLASGTTDNAGVACIDQHVSLADGVHPVLARFLGDTQYLPSQDSGVFGVPVSPVLAPVVLGGVPVQGPAAPGGSASQTAPISQAETAQQVELQSQAQIQAQSQAQAQANAMGQVQPGMMLQRRSQQRVAQQVANIVQGQAQSLHATGLRQTAFQLILVGVVLGFGLMLRRPAAALGVARRRPRH